METTIRKRMKQFGKMALIAVSIVIAGAVMSPIPSQAQTTNSSVIPNALSPSIGTFDFSDPSDPKVIFVTVMRTANSGYTLSYSIYDFNGTYTYAGYGPIPNSSVTVSGGSVGSGKLTITLNVDTCSLADFTTMNAPCGDFNLTWTEIPASIGGSFVSRGNTVFTAPGIGMTVINGEQQFYGAAVTGSILDNLVPTPPIGGITQQTNVTITVTRP